MVSLKDYLKSNASGIQAYKLFFILFFISSPIFLSINITNSTFTFQRIIEPETIDLCSECLSIHLPSLIFALLIFIVLVNIIDIILINMIVLLLLNYLIFIIFSYNSNIEKRIIFTSLQVLFFILSLKTFDYLFNKFKVKIDILSMFDLIVLYLSSIVIIKFIYDTVTKFNHISTFLFFKIYDLYQYYLNIYILISIYIGVSIYEKRFNKIFIIACLANIFVFIYAIKLDAKIIQILSLFSIILPFFVSFCSRKLIVSCAFLFLIIYYFDIFEIFSTLWTLQIRQKIYSDWFYEFKLIHLIFPLLNDFRVTSIGSMHSEFIELLSTLGVAVTLIYYFQTLKYINNNSKYSYIIISCFFSLIFFPSLIMNPTTHLGSSLFIAFLFTSLSEKFK